MQELPQIWLNLSSFIEDPETKETEFEIKKDFYFKDHRFTLKTPIKGKIRIQKTKNKKNLLASFSIKTSIILQCDRCLSPFTKSLKLNFERTISPNSDEEEIQLLPNNQIEVFEPIWQEIILKIPARAICQPNCKGICPVCGANWNKGKCPHYHKARLKEQKPSSPLADLKRRLKKTLPESRK